MGEGEGEEARQKRRKKKLSTFLPATNDMLENKSHLNKPCFTELGNKRFPNYTTRFASYTSPFYQYCQIMASFSKILEKIKLI
jgi:hypothetical protein